MNKANQSERQPTKQEIKDALDNYHYYINKRDELIEETTKSIKARYEPVIKKYWRLYARSLE